MGVGKKVFKMNFFSLYNLYGHALASKPLPWVHEIYNFGRPFRCHLYCIIFAPRRWRSWIERQTQVVKQVVTAPLLNAQQLVCVTGPRI